MIKKIHRRAVVIGGGPAGLAAAIAVLVLAPAAAFAQNPVVGLLFF